MFVEERTRPLLAVVCERLGLPVDQARLVRHHTNAVYAVADAVVKIAPPGIGIDDLRPTVALVQWLTQRGFPVVPLHPGPAQPLKVDGYAVTVWQRLDPAPDRPVTPAELGALLRQLHDLPPPPVALRRLDPVTAIGRSVAASTILTPADRDLMMARLDRLAAAWVAMRFVLASGLIHADPQSRNALRRADRSPVLADWDTAAIGPREWELATVAVHCRRFTPTDTGAFAACTAAYGWDPTGWGPFEELCQLRELKMIATNARKSRPGSPAASEVHRRIAALRDQPDSVYPWSLL